MCIRAVKTFEGPNMEFDLFKKIVDDGKPFLRYISLDGPGETTMNPDAFRMIRYAKFQGIRVMFSTNATLLDERTINAILDSGLDLIIFSINGTTPEVYEAVHGVRAFERAHDNIHRFLQFKLKRQSRIIAAVQMIRLPETQGQIQGFFQNWRSVRGLGIVRVKADVVCNRSTDEKPVSLARRPSRPCPRLWYGPIFVETNGDVYASPGVMYKAGPVGNLREFTLSQIWNNEPMQAMRIAHGRGEAATYPECRQCVYPQPRLPLVIAGFMLDPFMAGKLLPWAEKLAFWHRLPLFENYKAFR
jgi:radical SAM protein with 4Fe4S-binding SPASM domain